MTRHVVLHLFIISLIISACSPSESSIKTAIPQTRVAKPTNTQIPTNTPEPTLILTATELLTETPTLTNKPTSTLSPSSIPDVRVIKESPDKFLLQASDLPQDAKFFLPNSSMISPHHNSEIISDWGRREGMEYLEESGRIDGWWVYYVRDTGTVRAPEQIFHNIIQYQTGYGAQVTVKEFNYIERGDPEWEYIQEDISLGDVSIGIISKVMQTNDKYQVSICIDSAFRNYVSIVCGDGWEDEVSLEYVINIARIALEKLESAQLSEPNWTE